ncbi:hypothetical protein WDZ92_29635 [Nostoc sp. NIES-2111]
MQRNQFRILIAVLWTGGLASGQTLQEAITSLDKAVPTVHQTLQGTWLSELRRASPTGLQPPIPSLLTFLADGTSLASPADGTQSAVHGMWIRVGDRKFLGTAFFFNFNESRVLTTITKLRINYQLSADGKTLTGTTEAVVMDRNGRVLATTPGSTITMVRLSPEIPGDFYEFQRQP